MHYTSLELFWVSGFKIVAWLRGPNSTEKIMLLKQFWILQVLIPQGSFHTISAMIDSVPDLSFCL